MIAPALFPLLSLALPLVYGSPTPLNSPVHARQSIPTLSAAQISAFSPYTFYASTGYCSPSTTLSWTCGANCQANSGFIPVASGGDGALVQFWFVGFDPSLNTVIVSHQGTDSSKILPVITDANFVPDDLDSSLFPGLSSSIKAHSGFADAQAKTATAVLAAVQKAMTTFSATSVTTVGHSLGAAISLLDAVYLPLHLASGTTVRFVGYGLPRVGNDDFADYVDSNLSGKVTHINNKKDPVPILPGRFLGFAHPSGEVHIKEDNAWAACPGQDNTSDDCTVGDVPNIFEGDADDHAGPYNGITMGC